ncbi:MAG: group II intron reverse transcriptase/maturase [Crocosphaera sp.]|nr:group II intron reverse transcriptase/maturase [Crocosphaera sp.]
MEKTSLETTVSWNTINWAKIQRKVFKLQKKIFQAVRSGNKAKAHKLQKLLSKSYYAKLLAVRKVTQDNQGKKTAGVDGKIIIYQKQRLELANNLSIKGYKAKPLRRVWIPKPGRDEKRPLGIPTIQDRAMQALIKLALEPYWEAQFEPNSFGFRPGRSAHDAIESIFNYTSKKEKYVLDADIAKCFDKIDHQYLLNKLECPHFRIIIKQWLKAGVLDNGVFNETDTGTPQGGVISPLLANIALHGMETYLKEWLWEKIEYRIPRTRKGKDGNTVKAGFHAKKHTIEGIGIIRYADDFVVIHDNLDVIIKAKEAISNWLSPIGLEIKPSKTRICHTLNDIEIDGEKQKAGFNFLGFNVKQYPIGKHHSSKDTWGRLINLKLIISPSKEKINEHKEKLKQLLKAMTNSPQVGLISNLNPIIRGWANYYATACSAKTYQDLDNYLWEILKRWVYRRHKKKYKKAFRKYFRKGSVGRWTFQTNNGLELRYHKQTTIKRHTKIKGEATPYDGNWIYWSKRRGNYLETPTRVAKLLKKQKGKCNLCEQYFTPDDLVEIDHIIPKSKGGKDIYKNLQALHRHCHDVKSRNDGSYDVLTVPVTTG